MSRITNTNAHATPIVCFLDNLKKTLLNEFLDTFYPRDCILCSKEYNNQTFKFAYLCEECFEKLPKPQNNNICLKCQMPLGEFILSKPICQYCKKYRGIFKKLITGLYYKDEVENLIKEFKFNKKLYVGMLLSQILAIAIKKQLENSLQKIDYLTYVPMTYMEKFKRGFNQTEFLAKNISSYLKIPLIKAIIKIRQTKHQMELSFYERQQNIKNAFKINKKIEQILSQKNILIIDDIYTTGATLAECSRTLKSAGVKQVYLAVVARNIIK
jgi:ComF family protein